MKYYINLFVCCFSIVSLLCSCKNHNVKITGDDNVMSEVDLGLSVKWSNMNLGACKPEEFGRFYALGDVNPRDSICDLILPDNGQEWHDSLGVVYPKYDAASFQTKNEWRIPTIEEWTELGQKCKWRWATYKGVEGYHIEGPNGNSIFLPAAGDTESKYGDELNGFYRCSYVWDGGATFSVYFTKPKSAAPPKISLTEDLDWDGDVCFGTLGCQVPASIRPVKVK